MLALPYFFICERPHYEAGCEKDSLFQKISQFSLILFINEKLTIIKAAK